MSDTPRTDAFYTEHPIAEYEQTTVDPDDGMAWLEFARQLERELSARPEVGEGFVQSGSGKPSDTEVVIRPGPPLPEDFGCSHHSWKQIYGPPEYIANYHEAAAQYWRNMNSER